MHESHSAAPVINGNNEGITAPYDLTRNHSQSVHGVHQLKNNQHLPGNAQGVEQHDSQSYARLLLYNQCYDAMPTSSKMVVFDDQLILRKAFHGLIYQNTRHVLISNASKGAIIEGILSVTDFIRVMLSLHRGPKDENNKTEKLFVNNTGTLGQLTLKEYRDLIESEGRLTNLVSVDANQSLLEAARLLAAHHIHRLPVMDPFNGSPLFILTHKRILKFLYCFGSSFSLPEYHLKSCKELGVGTWTGIRVVFPDTQLVDCLDILLHKGVSGLPVVERESYKVVDMYSRFDAVGIALEDRDNCLDVTVEQALRFKNLNKNPKDRVVSIRDTDTLWKAVTVLVDRNVHRLCAVTKKGTIEGVISLSDVINYMVVQPGKDLTPPKPSRKQYKQNTGVLSDDDLRNLLHGNAARLEQVAIGRIPEEDTKQQ